MDKHLFENHKVELDISVKSNVFIVCNNKVFVRRLICPDNDIPSDTCDISDDVEEEFSLITISTLNKGSNAITLDVGRYEIVSTGSCSKRCFVCTEEMSATVCCENITLTSSDIDWCVDGDNFNQHIIKSDGVPSGESFWTDADGNIVDNPTIDGEDAKKGACQCEEDEKPLGVIYDTSEL